MNPSSPFTFVTAFSKSAMPLILTDTAVSAVLSINAVAIHYLNTLRVYITSSKELISLLQSFTKGNTPSAQGALVFQPVLKNSANQPVGLTVWVQQEFLAGKPVLLFSISDSTQAAGLMKKSPPPDSASPVLLLGIAAERTIEFINRSVPGIGMDQILGSNTDNWTLPEQFGDIRQYELAIETMRPVIFESKLMGPNEIPLEAKIYLSPIFEREALTGFVITAVPLYQA